MSKKKKISLSIALLCISAAIFGSYAIGGSSNLSTVKGSQESEAIDFAKSVIQTIQDKKPRDFISKSLNPKEQGLRDCYDSLQGVSFAANPEWEVKKAEENEVYHVFFKTSEGGKIIMMLKYTDKQWKFAYVTQG
jgi:hypothetical protein